ncbi:MAG: riboflavin biosynthesis protein RibF [Candidatus Omnitrophica bacterium]|nr:riboflavin biosynthesis protein RibF [Candidatus Omnitrophota bacterium]MCM8806841.1 riboflavin biosynthesis protein RibF [Candidatus Omnitrophota bacterium]
MEIKHFSDVDITGKGLSIGIGKFDGVHLGHKKIIEEVVKKAKSKRLVPSIFTFKHFPVEFYITSWEEKLSIFENSGIEFCVWCDYEEISFWQPFEFIEYLKCINVQTIVIGDGFKFGAHRSGKIDDLKREFDVFVINSVKIDGDFVNSTKIRELLKEGDFQKVNKFLGRNFSFKGKVITGNSRGKNLGFPTANLSFLNNIKIKEGVYSCWVKFLDNFYKGALSIGNCPTFGSEEIKVEVHILNFDKIIYGEILEIYPVFRIRDQKKFENIGELKEAIKKDIKIIEENLTYPF